MPRFFQKPDTPGYVLLAVFALTMLAHHVWGYVGHFGFDDIHYARLSKQWADGVFETSLTDHYTFRWGLIWLNGLVYSVFGMNDHSSAAVPMTAVLLTVWLVWRMSERLPLAARAFAMTFTALSEWVFFYSDKIMPDVLVMLCSTAAVASVWQHRWGRWQGRPRLAALALALSLLAGFLCKETILLTLPLFGWLMLADLWQAERRQFWLWAALSGLVGAILYLSTIYALTGDAWGRFRAIAANSYFSACSYDQLPAEHLWRRIGWELWRVFFETGVAVSWVFLLPALLLRRSWRDLLLGRTERDFWLLCAAALLLLSNFMSISPTAYLPLCPDIRHYLFAVPLVGLASAAAISSAFAEASADKNVQQGISNVQVNDAPRLGWATVALAVLSAALAWRFFPDQLKLYATLAMVTLVVIAGATWSRPGNSATSNFKLLTPNFFWLLLFLPLLWKPLRVMRSAQTSNYPQQKQLVQKHFAPAATPQRWLVISNLVEKNLDEYLLGFDATGTRFLAFKEVSAARIQAGSDSIALIINGTTAYLSGMDWEAMPFWVKQPDPSRRLLDTTRHIELFTLDKADLLRRLEAGR